MKKLMLSALLCCSMCTQVRSQVPEIFRRNIDLNKVGEAAAVVAMQCVEIFKRHGAQGIEIVKRIIQQVPELADQIRMMLKNAGYPV